MINIITKSKLQLKNLALDVYCAGDSDFFEKLELLKNEIQRLEYLRELNDRNSKEKNI